MTYTKLFLICFFSLLIIFSSYPNAYSLTYDDVIGFEQNCIKSEQYEVTLNFAPMIKNKLCGKNEFCYEFANNKPFYNNNSVNINKKSSVDVHLFTSVKSKNFEEETYLWMLIVSRSNNNWTYGGHIIHDAYQLSKVKRLNNLSEDLKNMSKSVEKFKTKNHTTMQPVYHNINKKKITRITNLMTSWQNVLGQNVFDNLIAKSYLSADSEPDNNYAVTTSLIPLPISTQINPETGYRWTMQKTIDKPGVAFGFIIAPDGTCIASSRMAIIPTTDNHVQQKSSHRRVSKTVSKPDM